MMAFQYLGQVLLVGYDDWIVVLGNLGKARKNWGRLLWILSREGVDPNVSGHFYKEVSQAVLMSRAELWVLNTRMERALDSFQHRVARRLTGRQTRRRGDGRWAYPPLEEEIVETGFEEIRNSVTRRKNTIVQYIAK